MLTDLIGVNLFLWLLPGQLRSVHSRVRIWRSLLQHKLVLTRQQMYEVRRLPLLFVILLATWDFDLWSFRQLFSALMSGEL